MQRLSIFVCSIRGNSEVWEDFQTVAVLCKWNSWKTVIVKNGIRHFFIISSSQSPENFVFFFLHVTVLVLLPVAVLLNEVCDCMWLVQYGGIMSRVTNKTDWFISDCSVSYNVISDWIKLNYMLPVGWSWQPLSCILSVVFLAWIFQCSFWVLYELHSRQVIIHPPCLPQGHSMVMPAAMYLACLFCSVNNT